MKARAAISIIALAILIPPSGFQRPVLSQTDTRLNQEFADQIKSLFIENPDGATEVQTWPGKTVRVTAPDPEGVTFDRPFPGALKVSVKRMVGAGPPNLIVYAPAHISLSVKGAKYPVTIRGLMAGASVETASGDIALYIPANSNADFSMRAFEGAIFSKLPLAIFGPVGSHSVDGKIGMGGAPIILRSLRGRINLLPDDPSRIAAIEGSEFEDAATTEAGPTLASHEDSGTNIGANAFISGRITEEQPAAIKLETRLVNLNVKVTDINSRSIANLRKEDFLVFEDGEQQEITYFEPITAPVNLVLLLDLSGSTRDKIKAMRKAARQFIESLNPGDRVAVAAFTRRFMVISNFTTDRALLLKRIDDMKNRSGGTAYYDAMWATLDLFKEINETRKAIVVLTDGVDNSLSESDHYEAKHPFDDLLDRIVREEPTIYPIYFDTEYEVVVKRGDGSHEEYVTAREQLQQIASQTGGMLFKAERFEDLDRAYQQVASELHTLYSLAYTAKNAKKDGRWRTISIKVDRNAATARTRPGYFAK